jgi:hypothetical protein
MEHEMIIKVVSSLNLRRGRGDGRQLDEPIDFTCTCGSECRLGRDSFVLAKIQYELSGESVDVVLCDRCMDLFIDTARFGPRVIEEGDLWELCSRAARISIVQDELYCFKCLSKDSTHLFMKFDDLSKDTCSYSSMRVCARCAISYLRMVLRTDIEDELEVEQ